MAHNCLPFSFSFSKNKEKKRKTYFFCSWSLHLLRFLQKKKTISISFLPKNPKIRWKTVHMINVPTLINGVRTPRPQSETAETTRPEQWRASSPQAFRHRLLRRAREEIRCVRAARCLRFHGTRWVTDAGEGAAGCGVSDAGSGEGGGDNHHPVALLLYL